jgi:hypothetical protein
VVKPKDTNLLVSSEWEGLNMTGIIYKYKDFNHTVNINYPLLKKMRCHSFNIFTFFKINFTQEDLHQMKNRISPLFYLLIYCFLFLIFEREYVMVSR